MTRTSPLLLAIVLLGAGLISFVADVGIVGNGGAAMHMPWAAGALLLVIGAALLAAAWPIRQAVRGTGSVSSTHATRVLGLAKASAIVGALMTGWAGGIVVFLLSRPVISGASMSATIVAAVGALVLLVAAVVAELWCMLPPDDEANAEAGS